MEAFAVWIAIVGASAITVTKAVDLIRNVADKSDTAPKWVWNVAAFGVGLGYTLGFQIDVTGELFAQIPALADKQLSDIAGQVVSGLAIGGFAGFWHEALDALHGVATRSTTITTP